MGHAAGISMRPIVMSALTVIYLLLAPDAGAIDTLKIGGTGHALGSMKLLVGAFERSHRSIKVRILPSIGSSGGIKAVSKGALDIGLLSRPLKNDEQLLAVSIIAYARTPFVFVANSDVKASDVNTREVIKIFRCETNTWPDGKRLRLILRPLSDSDSIYIHRTFPQIEANFDVASCRKGLHTTLTAPENLDLIEKTPGSFGVSTLTLAFSERHGLKILSFNGVPPAVKNRPNASYPMYMTLYLLIGKEPSEPVRRFVEFVQSAEGRKIIEESGNLFVSDSHK